MKQLPRPSSLFIIAVTANVLEDDRDRYKLAGMNDFIAKPVIFEDFDKVTHQWIK